MLNICLVICNGMNTKDRYTLIKELPSIIICASVSHINILFCTSEYTLIEQSNL